MKCNNCGYEAENIDICPLCDTKLGVDLNEDYSELFKEEEVNIVFNLRNILNDVDYKNEFENIQIEENTKEQYKGHDLTPVNVQKIAEINSYYRKSIQIFKKEQKNKLELFDILMLQAHVASFNEVVNNCNKFKKIVDDNGLIRELNSTIKLYNKEIHYIKKYFILPLYDTPGLLNRSRIVKALLDLLSVFAIYFGLSATGVSTKLTNLVESVTSAWGGSSVSQKEVALCYTLAVVGGIYLAEILFQIFLNLTIKNNNFQVDKNKKYEIHVAVALIGFILVCLHKIFFYIFSIVFISYIGYKAIRCFITKKWNLESILEKLAAMAIFSYFVSGLIPAFLSFLIDFLLM